MPKSFLIKIAAIITCLLFYFSTAHSKHPHKRALLDRELQYLKTRPLSADLQSFIDRHSRMRAKRSHQVDENLAYVYQDGHLVPLKDVKDVKRSEEQSETKDFNVVPLIIPNKQERSVQDKPDR